MNSARYDGPSFAQTTINVKTTAHTTDDPAIRAQLLALIRGFDHSATVHEELPIGRGRVRADIAVVNGHLRGFEIKSYRDSPRRLQRQVELYETVFDYSVVVADCKHLNSVESIIPDHWGIWTADREGEVVSVSVRRNPTKNEQTCAEATLKLAWRDETIRFARRMGLPVKSNCLVSELWPLMLESFNKDELSAFVRETLKARQRHLSVA